MVTCRPSYLVSKPSHADVRHASLRVPLQDPLEYSVVLPRVAAEGRAVIAQGLLGDVRPLRLRHLDVRAYTRGGEKSAIQQ